MSISHEGMDDRMEHGCRTCTHDHACNQGRCGNRRPADNSTLLAVAAATLGFWGLVVAAVFAWAAL